MAQGTKNPEKIYQIKITLAVNEKDDHLWEIAFNPQLLPEE